MSFVGGTLVSPSFFSCHKKRVTQVSPLQGPAPAIIPFLFIYEVRKKRATHASPLQEFLHVLLELNHCEGGDDDERRGDQRDARGGFPETIAAQWGDFSEPTK